MNDPHSILIDIFDSIDHRVNAITQAQPAWPCHQGCDLCCRQLPFLPEITHAEWKLLIEGFQKLPVPIRKTVRERVADVIKEEQGDSFVTCPLLDREKGECLVYAYRPAACRMYGYYVTRSGNRWCEMIQERYENGFAEGIILGNQQAVDRMLAENFGEIRPLENLVSSSTSFKNASKTVL